MDWSRLDTHTFYSKSHSERKRLSDKLLETHFETDSGNRRMVASIKALSITSAFFVLQAALVPLIINPAYIFWRAVAFVPLLLSIGIMIRLVPRFMPGANIVHALMAINVVLQYWKAK
jgi:hypothetical protein